MTLKKVQLNKIVKNQLPEYVRADFPLVGEFLSAYYKGQEYQGAPIDLVNNISEYIKLSECGNLTKSTILSERVEDTDTLVSSYRELGIKFEVSEFFSDLPKKIAESNYYTM